MSLCHVIPLTRDFSSASPATVARLKQEGKRYRLVDQKFQARVAVVA